jgi:outer membrane protein TolC
MNFEEKLDAMRMNLELAFHDIEALRNSIEAQRAAAEAQRESIEAQRESIEAQRTSFEAERDTIRELRLASAHQHETAQVLMKATQDLLTIANRHEHRITGLERGA